MAFTHSMQANRFELKYIITEPVAIGIRDFVKPYLEPDEFADPRNNNSYMIHSLYVDSPDLKLRNATVDGHKNRHKLRIRFYDDNPDNPLFFEIKRRVTDVILKQRVAVHRQSLGKLLTTPYPERSDLIKYDAKNWATLVEFCRLREAIHGEGRAFVSYLREAYVSPHDDSVRVTFDRSLSAAPFFDSLDVKPVEPWLQPITEGIAFTTKARRLPPPEWRPPLYEGITLELKFTDRFPGWMRDLVYSFNLNRGSMAKYVLCAESLCMNRLSMR